MSRKMGTGDGKHHPYCKFTYESTSGEWRCICDILKAYDKWRHQSAKEA